ncbi:MAG TPA: type II toxin-antitoxin system YafQ family toxin [Candidatus Rifleibacterium sp.]|jgi:mRNA interferase YafQ|nr:type II toxin-antitoxin system YafQ family toxin [Candidatus Rifleibacterium sp.]
MLKSQFGSKFKKDYKKAGKQGRDIDVLKDIVGRLLRQEKLESKFKDHELTGNWKGVRECHLAPDWLLLYRIDGDTIVFIRTGSHSEVL